MNVFVTGGAGYIGSVCVEELLDAGHVVTVFDNLSEGHRSAVDPRAKFIRGDLGDRDLVARALVDAQAEAVIHFAAHALVGESMQNPGKYFRNNVANGLNLLDAAVAAGDIAEAATLAAEVDRVLHGVPGVRALLGRPDLRAAVDARLDRPGLGGRRQARQRRHRQPDRRQWHRASCRLVCERARRAE